MTAGHPVGVLLVAKSVNGTELTLLLQLAPSLLSAPPSAVVFFSVSSRVSVLSCRACLRSPCPRCNVSHDC